MQDKNHLAAQMTLALNRHLPHVLTAKNRAEIVTGVIDDLFNERVTVALSARAEADRLKKYLTRIEPDNWPKLQNTIDVILALGYMLTAIQNRHQRVSNDNTEMFKTIGDLRRRLTTLRGDKASLLGIIDAKQKEIDRLYLEQRGAKSPGKNVGSMIDDFADADD